MSAALERLLNNDELAQLSSDARSKIERELDAKESSLDSLKAENERVKADYEQKCYEIDKKVIEMSAQLDSETTNCAKATTRCKELEDSIKSSREKSDALEMNFAESQGEIAALKHTHDLWKEEKLSMQHLIEKRDLEIAQIKTEWKTVSDKLSTMTTSKNEAELKLDELQNSGVTVQYHNKRLERERDLLTEQNEQLTQDLKAKSVELNSLKLNKENELLSLRGRLEIKMEECKQFATVSDNLRVTNSDLEKKINDLLEKVNSVEEERRSMEGLYRSELQSQVNLTDLYKASAKDEEEKAQQLSSAVQELQKLVNESAEALTTKQAELEEVGKMSAKKDFEIELLKKELEKANDLLEARKRQGAENLTEEELSVMCPTAAMASKFIKSGMTLTAMYTKYIDTLDDLEVSQQENKRLAETMDRILAELNEKAPILKKQREDYERALATITQLTAQMDTAAIECQQLRAEADDAGRKLARAEREKKRLQMDSGDLSIQVKYLLKEMEESHGRDVSMDRNAEADPDVSSSSEVISSRLVTFKNIEELQEQNRRLLQITRELSEENEKKENENQSDELKQFKEKLDEAKEELEKLRAEREKQTELVEAIVRQRDMYRVLLSQEPKSGIPFSILAAPSLLSQQREGSGDGARGGKDAPGTSSTSSSSLDALKVLKQEFDEYKKEVQNNNKVMNEQTENLRTQITELRTDNAKLQANENFSAEKYNVMKQSFDNIRKETDLLREKNTKLLVLVQKHELNISNVTSDFTSAKQEKASLAAKLDDLQSEMGNLRRTEERLRSENSSLQRDQRGQSVLLANLQKIQQGMEKQEFEVRSDLRSRIESQDRELKALRRSTNNALQQKQAALQGVEKQLLNAQKKADQHRMESESRGTEIKKLKNELEASILDSQSNVSKVAALEQRLSRIGGEKSTRLDQDIRGLDGENVMDDLKQAREKCKELEDELTSLKLKVEKSQRVVQQHKEFAAAAEDSLKQANEANRELSEALEARLKNASELQTKLEQRITVLEDENRQLNANKTSLISAVDLRTADLNKQLASLQSELDLVLKREKELRKSEQEARNEFTEQMDLIHDAQNKYQREMLLHAESVKELVELKEKIKQNNADLENAKNDAQQARHLLDSNKGMWDKQKTKMEQENEAMKERNKDMSEQIAALHTQLETVSAQMVTLQQKQATSPAAKYSRFASQHEVSTASTEDTTDKSSEQLMDIIKFLRKEKNLCEVKFEVAQSEANRLKQQASHLLKQADEAKKALQDERQKSQASSSELSKHEALMKKVETMNVLTDSNRMLRDEKERLQEELQTTKAALVEMKRKLAPLQAENNQLSTHMASLRSEKVILEQDVQRWQQRSQQLLQSPRRQDPEEYRKLIAEKQRMTKNAELLNKEITDKKLEVSNLQGEIRNLNQQTETLKTENGTVTKKLETFEAELKAKQTEIVEKNKMIMNIKRVGRRYKMQCEDLEKKQKEMEAEKAAESVPAQENTTALSDATIAEQSAKIAALEAMLAKTGKEKEDMEKQLEMKTAESDAMKSQLQHSKQKMEEESKMPRSDVSEENRKLMNERDEMKKQLQQKEDKSKKLLTLAKTKIEQFRKEKEEAISERDRLRAEDQIRRSEIEKLKQDSKTESEQKTAEFQLKIENLQKQLSTATAQQQKQKLVTNVGNYQLHHHPGTSGVVELRKAANIRPISTQRVSQVSPMRVTRTARVMPEPQQEAQEGSSSDSLPARSSSHASSSSVHHGPSMLVSTSTTLPTRAFVHPINPSSARHPHVVSSSPISSLTIVQIPTRSDATQVEQAVVVRGNTSSSTDNVPQEAAVASSAGGPPSADPSENDQAIVSSSDDQPSIDEGSQLSPPAGGHASAPITGSEAASLQSASSSGEASSIPVLLTHKRSYEEAVETNSTSDDVPASSSVAPMSKRQRSSPDQSSAALTSEPIVIDGDATTSQVQQPGSSSSSGTAQAEAKPSSERVVEPIALSQVVESQDNVGTSTFTLISDVNTRGSLDSQPVPTSSGAGDVIVVSSDDEVEENFNIEQEPGEIYQGEPNVGQEAEEVEDISEVPSNSMPPVLVLHPTPPEVFRNRPPIRPAPLTPGFVQPVDEVGDGIVPCTPTLSTRQPNDYQTLNSPHVPAGGPPLRFRFEDVAVPTPSLQPQGGIGAVDNTIMDFGDDVRSVPTTPIPVATVTTVTHTLSDDSQIPQADVAAVSSSIAEEEEDAGDVERNEAMGGEMSVPMSSSLQEETEGASSEVQETVSLQNVRGRRIRLIGGRSRGKDGTSPSTSNQ